MKLSWMDKITIVVISSLTFLCLGLLFLQHTKNIGPVVSGNFDWSPDGKMFVFHESDTNKLVFVNEEKERLSELEITSLSSETSNLDWSSENKLTYLIDQNTVGIFNLQTQKEEVLKTPDDLYIREICFTNGETLFARHGLQLTKQSLSFYNLNTKEWIPIKLKGYLQSMSCDKELDEFLIEGSSGLFTVSMNTDQTINVEKVGGRVNGLLFIDSFDAKSNTYFGTIDVARKAQARLVHTSIETDINRRVLGRQGIEVYVNRRFKYSNENGKMLMGRPGNMVQLITVNIP